MFSDLESLDGSNLLPSVSVTNMTVTCIILVLVAFITKHCALTLLAVQFYGVLMYTGISSAYPVSLMVHSFGDAQSLVEKQQVSPHNLFAICDKV